MPIRNVLVKFDTDDHLKLRLAAKERGQTMGEFTRSAVLSAIREALPSSSQAPAVTSKNTRARRK